MEQPIGPPQLSHDGTFLLAAMRLGKTMNVNQLVRSPTFLNNADNIACR